MKIGLLLSALAYMSLSVISITLFGIVLGVLVLLPIIVIFGCLSGILEALTEAKR